MKTKSDMRIAFDSYAEVLSLSKLKKSKYQRNKHPEDQIERLAIIMREHGVRHPIHISKLSGQVCFGHGRWEAAKKNGWTEFPVVYQQFNNEDEEYACVQSDNAIAHWAELDLSAINTDLANLGPDFDIDLLGIENFVLEPAEKFEAQADEDEVPEQVDTRCKLGDVWTLGRHRLMCGDSTSIDAIEKLMAGAIADMVFTDPPYGMKLDADYSSMGGTGKKHKNIVGDHDDFTPQLINTVFASAPEAKEVFMWGADYYAEHLQNRNDGSWFVWDKRSNENEIGKMDGQFGSSFELCWSKNRHKREMIRFSRPTSFWRGDERSVHPTQKPIGVIEWFFERYKGSSVLDLFGGSGSTLIACEKTNRKCFMMELDPHYCDVILARWEKYTGKTAERIDGETKSETKDGKTAKGNRRKPSPKSGRDKLLIRRNGARP